MVDAAQSVQRSGPAGTLHARTQERPLSASLVQGDAEARLEAYKLSCRGTLFSPAQNPLWVSAWTRHGGSDPIVATLESGGRAVLSLALEVVDQGPFRLARFVGGGHANGNFPAVRAEMADTVTPAAVSRLIRSIRDARPDVDVLALERQAPVHAGIANPLLALPSRPSPNVALAVDLDGGFDALLDRVSGKRKRKKHRSQTRKYEAAGGFRHIEAGTPQEVDRMLSAFFEMKHARFAKMGIQDVFAPQPVQAAFRAMFRDALAEASPSFVVHGLEVGGTLRAITGLSRTKDRIICEFSAIRDDELSDASPGDFLFFEDIKAASEEGLRVYDFSVGDEHYKRMWCDIETRQRDVFVPLTAKGRLFGGVLAARGRVARLLKENPRLWNAAKRLRRRMAGGA